MKQVPEAARQVDVTLETDVLVVGSSPGSLAAADVVDVQQELERQGALIQ